MNGYTLQSGLLAKQNPKRNAHSKPPKLPALCFALMMAWAIALAASELARAETMEMPAASPTGTPTAPPTAPPTALPKPVNFLTGMVAITWTYRNQDSMPFTEHHAITSAHVAEAVKSEGPIRVPTSDEGELLIGMHPTLPGVLISARRYVDWTLVSVLRYENDPSHSQGVFEFCSQEESNDRCVASLVNQPDGTITMSTGNKAIASTNTLSDLDEVVVKNQLLALLTP